MAKNAVWIRAIAAAMGYPQKCPTILLCDNTTAVGLANDSIKTAKTKAVDMRYHWLRDRARQGQFRVMWAPTDRILADFFTKPLPVHKHLDYMRKLIRPATLHNAKHAAHSAAWRASQHRSQN